MGTRFYMLTMDLDSISEGVMPFFPLTPCITSAASYCILKTNGLSKQIPGGEVQSSLEAAKNVDLSGRPDKLNAVLYPLDHAGSHSVLLC